MRQRSTAVGWLFAVVLSVMSLALAAPAQAHSSQIGSTPEAGSVLTSPPSDVVVEFDSALLDIGAAIVVRTADGQVVSTGAPRVERRSLSTAIAADAPNGSYTVAYRVVSQDGHTIESSFTFQVGTVAPTVAPTATPTATPASTPAVATDVTTAVATDDGHSVLVWIVAGVLLVVIIGVGTVLLRR